MDKRIIGIFIRQEWIGNYAHKIDDIDFDATHIILDTMSLSDIHALYDGSINTDNLGKQFVEHDGPFDVEIESSICKFFDIDNIADLTEDMFAAAKAEWDAMPMQKYTATVQRTVSVLMEIDVRARTQAEAEDFAVEQAMSGDRIEDWQEHFRQDLRSGINEEELAVINIE